MSDVVRKPQQQRSIDTKNRIVAAGYKLFAEKGFYRTNTAEIAKEAGVSTGIVYGYFRDKRDILVEVLDLYVKNAYDPLFTMLDTISAPIDYDALVPDVIDKVVAIHTQNAAIHEALDSLSHTDDKIRETFVALENKLSEKIVDKLTAAGLSAEGVNEKVHLSIKLVASFAHEYVYDKHDYIYYPRMRKMTANAVKHVFTENV